jgi:hypothetical protein
VVSLLPSNLFETAAFFACLLLTEAFRYGFRLIEYVQLAAEKTYKARLIPGFFSGSDAVIDIDAGQPQLPIVTQRRESPQQAHAVRAAGTGHQYVRSPRDFLAAEKSGDGCFDIAEIIG